jgi:AraC family transcriptional regulator
MTAPDTFAPGLREADVTGSLLRVFAGSVPEGRTPRLRYARHRFVFPLVQGAVTVTCHRDAGAEPIEIPFGGCAAIPHGSEASWTFPRPFRMIAVEVAPDVLDGFARDEMRMLVTGNRIDGRLALRARELGRIARRLDRCLREDGPGRDVLLDALSRVFLVTLIREYAIPDDTPARFGPKLSASRFARLQEIVRERLDGPIRVPDLAAALGMSESTLARALKAAVGRTPAQFVLDLRLRRAREMIGAGREPIAAVASACGFADQAHLARAFRAAFDVTPRHHRLAAAAARGAAARSAQGIAAAATAGSSAATSAGVIPGRSLGL